MAPVYSASLSLMNLEVRLTIHLSPRGCGADWKSPSIGLAEILGIDPDQNYRAMRSNRLSRVERGSQHCRRLPDQHTNCLLGSATTWATIWGTRDMFGGWWTGKV